MAVSIGPRIQVDGEEQYRQQINQLVQVSKTLDAEIRAMAASFDENATAQEKARATSYALNEQLDVARQRTELVREMTMKAAETTEEDSAATLKWRQALAAAEEEQARLERAVRENTAAIEDETEATQENSTKMISLGDAVDTVAGKLGVRLPDSAKEALSGMEGFSAGTVAAMAASAAAVAVVVKVARELYDITVESARKVDDLNTRSAQTGLDASLLQQLDYAQRFLDFDGIDKTLVKLTDSMTKARDGAEAQSTAFERLEIRVLNTDRSLRNNWETFLDVIDALGKIENATERDTLANSLFGEGYTELKPLVDAGTYALTSYMQKAEDLGIVLDDVEREKMGRLADTLEDNEARWDALKDKLALAFAPALSYVIDKIDTAITGLTKFVSVVENTDLNKIFELNNSEQYGYGLGYGELTVQSKEYSEALRVQNELEAASIQAEAAYQKSLSETAARTAALIQQEDQLGEAMIRAEEAYRAEFLEQMQEDLQALAEEYGAAYDAALNSLDGQFSLWQQAEEVSALATETMLAGLQSQLDYWNDYAANFEDLMSRNIEGIEGFAENFMDGSKASAEALAGLKNASDEEIAAIIAKMAETDEAKKSMAERFAALETDLDDRLTSIGETFGKTMSQLQDDADSVDFGPFEASVDEAFGFLEGRASSAVAAVETALSRLSASIGSAGGRFSSYGYNAGGTDSWRGGLTWVGEAGPELVSLPRGSQIIPAAESRELIGGPTTYNITVANIQELDEIVEWYESRRIRERMA